MNTEQKENHEVKLLIDGVANEPHNAENFLNLGLYFYKIDDKIRARKVWEEGLVYHPSAEGILNNFFPLIPM
jgi:Tfp pilus assembly protein PilF